MNNNKLFSIFTLVVLITIAFSFSVFADGNNETTRETTTVQSNNSVVTIFAGSTERGFADGIGEEVRFHNPSSMAVDGAGNVYVADDGNYRIRMVTPEGVVTTLAGSGVAGFADGTGAAARFGSPAGITIDSAGNLYVTDNDNSSIRKVTPEGVVTTLAGSTTRGFADGTGAAARFFWPNCVAVDSAGNVYTADFHSGRIRRITPEGVVTTLEVDLGGRALAVDGAGNVYVARDHRIYKITFLTQ